MKKLIPILLMGVTTLSIATVTSLEEYAYDFATIGYDVTITGDSTYFDPMNAGDYFTLEDSGYTLETRIDGMSRKGKKEFIKFYNANCEISWTDVSYCNITVTGETELNEMMALVLTATSITFNDHGKTFK